MTDHGEGKRVPSPPLPTTLRPVGGFPVVDVVPTGVTSAQRAYTARCTVLTVQPAWWQHRMRVRGPFVLYRRPDPGASVIDRVMLGSCLGLPLAEPVESIRLFVGGEERRAVVRNHVWTLEK